MNQVYNSSFEKRTNGWEKELDKTVSSILSASDPMLYGKGENGGKENVRSARGAARLGGGMDGISQRLKGLNPNTRYIVSAWAQLQEGQKLAIGIRNYDTDTTDEGETVEITTTDANDGKWKRYYFYFTTGDNAAATVYLRTLNKTTVTFVSVDDVAVQEYTEGLSEDFDDIERRARLSNR